MWFAGDNYVDVNKKKNFNIAYVLVLNHTYSVRNSPMYHMDKRIYKLYANSMKLFNCHIFNL